jgi:molybdopterin converting factor small subunit
MKVTIQYYAMLREQAGRNVETRTTTAATPRALYMELGFTLPVTSLRAAVNGSFVALDSTLKDGDEVAFIPPVAGG